MVVEEKETEESPKSPLRAAYYNLNGRFDAVPEHAIFGVLYLWAETVTRIGSWV